MTLDNSLKIKNGSSSQKKTNSTLEDNEKNYYPNSAKENCYIYGKYVPSSSLKHYSNIKSTFNNLIVKYNPNNKVIIPGHMKNSSLFSSTLSALYKPKNSEKLYFENKIVSKTSHPTSKNSRKNSNDKRSSGMNNSTNNNNINGKNNQIKVNSNNYYHNSLLLKNEKIKKENNNYDIKKVSSDKIKTGIKYSKNIFGAYSKDNSKSISKNQSKNNSKDNILISSQRKNQKETKQIKDKNIENKLIFNYKQNEKEINEKNNKINNKEKEINIEIKKENQESNLENKKETEVEKINNKKPDCDIENEENLNDSFLSYLNSNLDVNQNLNSNINNTNTLNESYDSVQSILKENGKFSAYNHDMEIISSYIKKYYQKNKKYPSTKMKFYKYGRLLGKGAFGKVNLALHVLTGRLVAIKSINKTKLTNERHKAKILLETSIMKSLSSSNYIVKIYETYQTQNHFCIVMEYICAGDLLSYIRKRSKLNEQIAKFIFKQIILSLQFIHSHNIVERYKIR